MYMNYRKHVFIDVLIKSLIIEEMLCTIMKFYCINNLYVNNYDISIKKFINHNLYNYIIQDVN